MQKHPLAGCTHVITITGYLLDAAGNSILYPIRFVKHFPDFLPDVQPSGSDKTV